MRSAPLDARAPSTLARHLAEGLHRPEGGFRPPHRTAREAPEAALRAQERENAASEEGDRKGRRHEAEPGADQRQESSQGEGAGREGARREDGGPGVTREAELPVLRLDEAEARGRWPHAEAHRVRAAALRL